MTFIEELTEMDACPEAVEWAKQFNTLQDAWNACEKGNWMLWYAGRKPGSEGSASRRKLVLCAAKCARLTWEWMPEKAREALLLAERYGQGDESVSIKQLRTAAYDATSAAAYDASAAASAAYDATYAAYAAASAAYAPTYAEYAATLKKCVEIVREMYPTPPTGE